MKNLLSLSIILCFSFGMTSCLQDECSETRTFIQYEPVYMSEEDIAESIQREKPRPLVDPGIIYFYQNMILINEKGQGIHLIDNENPSNPQNIGFLSIPGNQHFAVKDHYLQADHVGSLLSIDLRNLDQPKVSSRVEAVFEEPIFQQGRGYLVGYRATAQKQILDCADPNFSSLRWRDGGGWGFWVEDRSVFTTQDFWPTASFDNSSGGNVGTGGSTARFTIAGGHLYTVSQYDLKTFDLNDASKPRFLKTNNMGWGIETIYPFKDLLFIGSSSGMFIYDIANPSDPKLQSSFSHATACDPVVANDETAFVTLRDGNECQGFTNQMDVIDVGNVNNPFLIESYAMLNPHGLALDGETLYVCEGNFGLRVLDISNLKKVKTIKLYEDIRSIDVISLPDNILLVIGKDGFKQFDVSNPKKFKLLSHIPVQSLS